MPSGAFRATLSESGEADVRFLYCACAISAILQDWSAVDCDRAVEYILQCITYEGGIAVMPGTALLCYGCTKSVLTLNTTAAAVQIVRRQAGQHIALLQH
jgi:prenyltransferase beta subunit